MECPRSASPGTVRAFLTTCDHVVAFRTYQVKPGVGRLLASRRVGTHRIGKPLLTLMFMETFERGLRDEDAKRQAEVVQRQIADAKTLTNAGDGLGIYLEFPQFAKQRLPPVPVPRALEPLPDKKSEFCGYL
jgi:hypothetical protein